MTEAQRDLLLILAYWALRRSSETHRETLARAIQRVTDEANAE